jgi:hypothetical protein
MSASSQNGPLRAAAPSTRTPGRRARVRYQLRRPRHPRRRGHRGRNRIHLAVEDLDAEIARLRGASLSFRSDLVTSPAGAKSCSPTQTAT